MSYCNNECAGDAGDTHKIAVWAGGEAECPDEPPGLNFVLNQQLENITCGLIGLQESFGSTTMSLTW